MLFVSLALAALAVPQEQEAHVYQLEDVQLTVDLSSLKSVKTRAIPKDGPVRGRWRAKFGSHRLEIEALVYSNRNLGVSVPEDLLDITETYITDQRSEAGH